MTVSIHPLADRPETIPALAALYRALWPDWYGPDGRGSAEADLADRARPSGLPFAVVALDDATPVGTAALAATSYGAGPGERPWLVGLAVAPAARNRGIASALVAALEARAAGPVFATTSAGAGLLLRRGWSELRTLPTGEAVLRTGGQG